MPSTAALAVIVLTMAVAGAMQASTGMGFALLAVPVLVAVNPHLVPGPFLMTAFVLTAMSSYRDRADVYRRLLGRSCIGLVIGAAGGATALKLLVGIDPSPVFGVLVLLAVGLSLVVRRVMPTPAMVLTGSTAAAFMGTMVGVCGPAVALVFQNERAARTRAMLNAFALLNNIAAMASLAAVGLFGRRELVFGLLLMPGMIIGCLVARLLLRHVNRWNLRPVILAIAAIGAIGLLFQ